MDILTAGGGRTVAADPLVRWTAVLGPERGCRTLWEGLVPALTEALGGPPETPGLPVLRDLGALPEGTERIWALHAGREVLALTAEEPKPLLLAFDLGTTTLAGFLLDGITGETLAVGSAQNPQAAYGADVIARIDAAAREGVEPLRAAVRQGMLQVAEDMAARTGRALGDVVLTVLAGNTCMHHLALGIPPAALGAAPYVPVARAGMLLPAEETGLPVHPAGKLAMLPDLAGFVGADTAACLLAAEFDRREELTLLLDIGTNGEMVLGDRHRRIACSTAAGPAFEGAKLRCGMRGTAGAIDHVRLAEGRLSVHVVGEGRARGICGSGLLDAAAALLESGLMDESGALLEPEELEDAALADRLTEIDGMPAVVLAPAEDSVDGSPVVLTQMDIRELQLAKAAVAAGIRLMAEDFGAALEDIGTVLIAGAFGNFMDPESALRIGLLPRELAGKLHMIGNAAGAGACLAARNGGELARCEALADGTDYLELAVHRGFSDLYLEEMSFPEQ
nr:ASKHA domain-containing protein [Pseudoflavonifractor sp. MSJ-37]